MHNATKQRHRRAFLGAFAAAGALPLVGLPSVANAQDIPQRKPIDALSKTELDAYKRAIGILVDRSKKDAKDQTGYAWQARLHNDFERTRGDGTQGACEHHNEMFFPWHRAHLASFERILRETDPVVTSRVAIPYWNWTQPASGKRFPLAFEDKTSPLYHSGRRFDAPQIVWPMRADQKDLKTLIGNPDWLRFGGEPLSQGGSFGSVEDGPHNTIHGAIGPTMGNPATAARDPIFWSFHAFIDLTWVRWQRLHASDGKTQPFTTPGQKIWVEPFTPTMGEMAQIAAMPAGYSYSYDFNFAADGVPAEMLAARESAPLSVRRTGPLASRIEAAPAAGPRETLLRVRRIRLLEDTSYELRAYVLPKGTTLASLTPAKKMPFLAASGTVWRSGGHSHGRPDMLLDISKAVAGRKEGEYHIEIETVPLGAEPGAAQLELNRKVGRLAASGGPLFESADLEVR